MIRTIIKIDPKKCNGCGLCVSACQEGAIGMTDGKAALLREDYCDGLGNCLPVCPTGAITFEEREAAPFDEASVNANMDGQKTEPVSQGCPGAKAKAIQHTKASNGGPSPGAEEAFSETHLNQWPVQLKLLPVKAPYFDQSHLLIAADCAAYAYGRFHNHFMKNKITAIGCPKLDQADYSVKLTEILKANEFQSVTVVRMEVPCCGGIEHAVKTALKNCGKIIPWQVITISTDGKILD